MPFARYHSKELRVVYFNGAGYVIRKDEYPHTTGTVTRQGSCIWAGIRQGIPCPDVSSDTLYPPGSGLAFRRYIQPDTDLEDGDV